MLKIPMAHDPLSGTIEGPEIQHASATCPTQSIQSPPLNRHKMKIAAKISSQELMKTPEFLT